MQSKNVKIRCKYNSIEGTENIKINDERSDNLCTIQSWYVK